jgi:hypothetical protein
MPDNLNQPNITPKTPMEPAPEVIASDSPVSKSSPVLPNLPFSPNSPSSSNSPTPPAPSTPPPPLPKSEILTPDIAPKNPSKTKIILASIFGLFFLGAVAGAVVLVKQNQDIRKFAAEGDGCEYGQACGTNGTQSCSGTIQGGTCKYDPGVNPNCSACGYCGDGNCGGGEGADNCPQDCSGGSNPRTASQVCTAEGGSATSTCTADPGCTSRGGACCDKSGTNYCCYGDSAGRTDGACYAGGDSGVNCSGTTITNNTGGSVTIRHFTKNPDANNFTCPLTAAGGSDTTLAAGQSTSASGCEQIDAVGYCGVCNDAQCNPPQGTPTATQAPTATPTTPPGATVTPTTAIACECVIIKVYDTDWRQYPERDLSSIKPGDTIIFTVQGQTTQGTIDKARFKINNGDYQETSSKKTGTEEYYYQYTVPNTATAMNIEAEVHLVETGSWY